MSVNRRNFRPDMMPERMYREDPADLYDLYVPTPKLRKSGYIYCNTVTPGHGKTVTDSHKVRQRRHNQRVIRDALRGEE